MSLGLSGMNDTEPTAWELADVLARKGFHRVFVLEYSYLRLYPLPSAHCAAKSSDVETVAPGDKGPGQIVPEPQISVTCNAGSLMIRPWQSESARSFLGTKLDCCGGDLVGRKLIHVDLRGFGPKS